MLNDLGPDKFKQELIDFDKDNIPESVIKAIDPVCALEEFTPEAIVKVSVACEAMCLWCHAMRKYYYVALEVEPKRRQLAQAEKSKTPPEGVKAMFAQARADMAKLEADRFPAPEVIECEQYGSKARYLTQKLHSDVPLDEFLRGLYKAVVS